MEFKIRSGRRGSYHFNEIADATQTPRSFKLRLNDIYVQVYVMRTHRSFVIRITQHAREKSRAVYYKSIIKIRILLSKLPRLLPNASSTQ